MNSTSSITPREQTIAFLRRAQRVLVTAPQKWSGDEISAMLALHKVLSAQGKEVVILASADMPSTFKFLEGEEVFKKDLGEQGDFVISLSTEKAKVERVKYIMKDDSVDILISPKDGFFSPSDVSFNQNAGKFDAIVVLGADTLEELGNAFEAHTAIFAETPIINISVSATNVFFGKINLVDPSRSSVCEILFELFQKDSSFNQHIDKTLATILLTGIISRTGSFLEASTTASGFETAAELQSMGARQSDIIENLFKMKSLATLKVWGRVLGNLEMDMVHKITWSALTKADFELAESDPSNLGDITQELLRHTKDTELAVLFIEDKKNCRVQIRSNHPNFPFTELNRALGGSAEHVEYGLDLEISQKTVAEIQFDILRLLVKFQKKRLNVSEEIEIQKMELQEISPLQTAFPLEKNTLEKEVLPTPPSEIPFDVPLQASESSSKIENVPPGTRAAEVTIDPDNSGIPDWLKQSFPKQ